MAFTPATKKLGQKWAEHDAKKSAEKGLAPSKFDRYLLMASDVASMASGTGAMGKFGSAAYTGGGGGGAVNQLSGWQNKLKQGGQVASMMSGSHPNAGLQNYNEPDALVNQGGGGGWQGQLAGMIGNEIARREAPTVQGQAVARPSSFQQRLNPVERGRQEALRNQPFRAGYNTQVQGDDDQIITAQMPPIYPQSPPVSESAPEQPSSQFMDNLTPRRTARRRNPVEEEQVYE